MMVFGKKTKDIALFFVVILVLSLAYNYHHTIFKGPYSNHMWRQCDALSITMNYYEEGMNFFEPSIHFQGENKGKGIGEFPVIYYINAMIWKLTGPNYFTIRLLHLLICFLGLFYLYKLTLLILDDRYWSMAVIVLLFTSPLFAFYANNFLVNVPALCLMFISWFYLYKYYQSQRLIILIYSMAFATLSILLRPTMIIGIAPLYVIYLAGFTNFFSSHISKNKITDLVVISIPVLILFCWYKFSTHYNEINRSTYFLTTIRPIWEVENKREIAVRLYNDLFGEFHFEGIKLISLLLFFGTLITFKRQNKYTLVSLLVIALCLVCYVILWYHNLNVHDYYLIEFLLLFIPIFIGFLANFQKQYHTLSNLTTLKIIVGIGLSILVYACAVKTRIKYNTEDLIAKKSFILSQNEYDYWQWSHWNYNNTFKPLETIRPTLRSLGIDRNDIVISIPDESPNVSLSLMDQKGYTNLYSTAINADRIRFFIEKGANYLIINDPSLIEQEYMKEFTSKKLGEHGRVLIYDLRGI